MEQQIRNYLSNIKNVQGLKKIFEQRRDAAMKANNITYINEAAGRLQALQKRLGVIESGLTRITQQYDALINSDKLEIKPLLPRESGLANNYTERYNRLLQRKMDLVSIMGTLTETVKIDKIVGLLYSLEVALTDLQNKGKIIAEAYKNSEMSKRCGEGDADIDEVAIENSLKNIVQQRIKACLNNKDVTTAATNMIEVMHKVATNYRQ